MVLAHAAVFALLTLAVAAQTPAVPARAVESSQASADGIAGLSLTSDERNVLREALANKSYRSAESLLLTKLKTADNASQRDGLLIELGEVYFFDHDAMQAAISWKKAEVIAPLPKAVRFSLAMAYIQTGHEDWAENLLNLLRSTEPTNALYPFWLGRIDYDRQHYDSAILHFREALELEPALARAHDNLGLCLYDVNQVDAAMIEFKQAIALETGRPGRSPWPYLNLGIAFSFRGQTEDAVIAFQQSLAADKNFAQAHYHLGNTLLQLERLEEATIQEKAAAALDEKLAEPHLILSRIYRRQGQYISSKIEEAEYKRVRSLNEHPLRFPAKTSENVLDP